MLDVFHGEWPAKAGLSAGTGKLCIFGHLGLVFIWSCFVSRLLFPLYYVSVLPYSQKEPQRQRGVHYQGKKKVILHSHLQSNVQSRRLANNKQSVSAELQTEFRIYKKMIERQNKHYKF